MFIKLTDSHGEDVYINMNFVRTFWSCDEGSFLVFKEGNEILVKETVELIACKIRVLI